MISWRLTTENSVQEIKSPDNPVAICHTYILHVTNNGTLLVSGRFKISLGANTIEEGTISNGVSPPLNLERLKVWHGEYEITINPPIT